jgi:hypothetical protein
MGAQVTELDAARLAGERSIFSLLQDDTIIVIRNMPEIRELGSTLRRLAGISGGRADEIEALMQTGKVASVEALAAFHAAFRHLRDSRYLSCLFSDAIADFGLPMPILVDSGFCRMVVPDLIEQVGARPDLFAPTGFESPGPGEAEPMLQGGSWGHPHRDIDGRHYHYQLNFWFPLHDLDKRGSLLLFPDAYRKDVLQYGRFASPDNPDDWGFGRALQVPLKFGDTLVFHSQQLHASPAFGPGQSRFTVEMRVAAACIDDNARTYRRLFWSLGNFRNKEGASGSAPQRAAQLAQAPVETPRIEAALRSETAHAIVHRLFPHAGACLAAGYVRRRADVLDDAIRLDTQAVQHVFAALETFPCGEDLWLLMARLCWRQGHEGHARAAVERIGASSESYFWALEAGRVSAQSGAYDLAAAAFNRAGQLAAASRVALDAYTQNQAPPRIPGWVPQVLPLRAQHAARILVGRARMCVERGHPEPRAARFDYQVILKPRWKRWIGPLLRSTGPREALMRMFARLAWRLRSARSFLGRATPLQ